MERNWKMTNESKSCLIVKHTTCIDTFCICICHRYLGYRQIEIIDKKLNRRTGDSNKPK